MKIRFSKEIKSEISLDESQLINLILKNRNIKDKKEFLHPTSPLKITIGDFGAEYSGKIKKVLPLLKKIKENNQMVVVYTDYDADGITGGAILWETLYLLGFKVMPYVPHRKKEGYGFSIKGIEAVKKQFNPALIISVDHGITAWEKIKYAKSLGIKVIVTDHHLKPEKLPTDAEAIFHIPELSGSGVAYFFAKEVFEHFSNNNFPSDYLALASIGTIADLVPLIGPSRSIVKYGLEAFAKVKRHGLRQILKDAGIEGRKVTPYEVGFMIAPRINAVGRLEHAIDALRLLCTKDPTRAQKLAAHVGEKNRERQDMVNKSVEIGEQMLPKILPKIIILENKNWHEGVIGLIASKIAEKYYRPTIILTESDGFLKGSARSPSSLHITNFLRDLKDYLIDVGGHKGAAGFTMEKNKLHDFIKKAQKKADKLIKEKDLEKIIAVDLKIPLNKINLSLTKSLEKLQPFGIGNPQPTFYSQGKIIDAKMFGKNQEHLKIYVKNRDSFPLELISFYTNLEFTKLAKGEIVDIVYNLEIDRWGGSERVRGKLILMSISANAD